MFKALKRSWHKAQALSVLQNGWSQQFKEPLDTLTETDLQMCMKIVLDAGGTPFDTAMSFMMLRADTKLRMGEPADILGIHMLGGSMKPHMKLWDQQMIGINRMYAVMKEMPYPTKKVTA